MFPAFDGTLYLSIGSVQVPLIPSRLVSMTEGSALREHRQKAASRAVASARGCAGAAPSALYHTWLFQGPRHAQTSLPLPVHISLYAALWGCTSSTSYTWWERGGSLKRGILSSTCDLAAGADSPYTLLLCFTGVWHGTKHIPKFMLALQCLTEWILKNKANQQFDQCRWLPKVCLQSLSPLIS